MQVILSRKWWLKPVGLGLGPVSGLVWAFRANIGDSALDLSDVSRIEQLCAAKGIVLTDQRRLIARVLSASVDHPDAEEVHRRAVESDPGVSISTVYRTLKLFEETGVIERHDFGAGRARYEEASEEHHDHLIDLRSGRVIEFHNEAIEALQKKVAEALGYNLVGHRLELYAVPLEDEGKR